MLWAKDLKHCHWDKQPAIPMEKARTLSLLTCSYLFVGATLALALFG